MPWLRIRQDKHCSKHSFFTYMGYRLGRSFLLLRQPFLLSLFFFFFDNSDISSNKLFALLVAVCPTEMDG